MLSRPQPAKPALATAGVVALALSVGCFRSPDVDKIQCIDNASCPPNFTCAIVAGQGKCTKQGGIRDAAGGDLVSVIPPSDGSFLVGDLPEPPNGAEMTTPDDGATTETTSQRDMAVSDRNADLRDGALDVPGAEASADLPIDKPLTPVDSGCSPAAKQCSGLQPQACDSTGKWQNSGAACTTTCDQGICATAGCISGTKQCLAQQPKICDSAGLWQDNGPICQFVCANASGTCTGTCAPGSKQCTGQQPQTCDATGAWQSSGTLCTSVCNNATGACSGACTPGGKQCSLQQPQTCASAGTWQDSGTACQYVCDSTTGTCTGTCKPGDKQCTGSQPQVCNASGTWESNGSPCSTNACIGGTCTGVCVPNSVNCNGSQPQTCDSTGVWQPKGSACPYACSSGICTGSCKPGNTQCNVAQPQLCDAGGNWQNSGSVCRFVCSAGACTGSCSPGDRQCASPTQPQTCDDSGAWQNNAVTCGGACETCSSGQCIIVSGNPPSGKTCNGSDVCAGSCDGQKATCSYPSNTTPCGTASCANGTVNNTACNSAGSCLTPVTRSCNGFPCSGSDCVSVCTAQSSSGCLPGYKCVGGNTCVTATLPCGTGTCPWGSKVCCAAGSGTNADAIYTCITPGATCQNSAGVTGSTIACSTKAECPSGQVCCDKGYSYGYTGMWGTLCTTLADCSSTGGFAFQTCDPSLSPSECASGTCQLSPTGIPGLYTCQ